MWCLHGIVKAPNFLSWLSLKQRCQPLAEKKDDFINDLINHQKSPCPHISLLSILLAHHSFCMLLPKPHIAQTHTHTQGEGGTRTHTPALFQDTATQVALSFLLTSPDFNLLPPWPAGRKVPKSNVTTILEAQRSVNYHHKRTTVSQPAQNWER